MACHAAFVYINRLLLLGGAGEDRTPDPLRAKQALSQLSYGPSTLTTPFVCIQFGGSGQTRTADLTLIRGAL